MEENLWAKLPKVWDKWKASSKTYLQWIYDVITTELKKITQLKKTL
jgi:hypothetical protein